ncbi:hypothetical protein [Acrocarpospora phusangensis]|uniref:hypothetical protein n=1 Tax=Acrocarpospora phusangensis TaxID=1070424 RepID=UPI0019524BEB|nr:hypothetical protein [Acrocarpospora phusangensis]
MLSHCLRARRLTIIRDSVITLLLFMALLLNPAGALSTLYLVLPLAILALPLVRRNRTLRIVVIIWAAWTALTLVAAAFVAMLVATVTSGLRSNPFPSSLSPAPSLEQSIAEDLATLGTIFVIGSFVTAIAYWVFQYVLLSSAFRPGDSHHAPSETHGVHRDRQHYVNTAQWGNLTLYDGEDPFIGAGPTNRTWSIVVELDRRRSAPGAISGARRNVTVDPVELHRFIRERLTQMRDDVVNPYESISRLLVSDHLTTRGTFQRADWRAMHPRQPWLDQSHPMIDSNGLPKYALDEEAIAAVIRHPQGALRYYQRVTVGAEGPAITKADGEPVIPGIDREIDISAFIYLAVEGRMMYTQFVVAVLPPCKREYHVIDVLPALSVPQVAWRALRAIRLNLAGEVLFAPFRLVRLLATEFRNAASRPRPERFLAYPFGARQSVREMGAEAEPTTFMQVLDIDKYSKLISQRLTEAVLDFLEDREIDTAAYRQQAAMIVNYGALITGGQVTGPVAAGASAQAMQTQAGAS